VRNANDIILSNFLELSRNINQEQDIAELIRKVMTAASEAATADGCFFFEVSPEKYMSLTYANINSLNTTKRLFENFNPFYIIYLSHSIPYNLQHKHYEISYFQSLNTIIVVS